MRIKPVSTSLFGHDAEGGSLLRWLSDADLFLPGPRPQPPAWPGNIRGAYYRLPSSTSSPSLIDAWVIFFVPVAIQIISDEVHSHWFLPTDQASEQQTGIWVIEESPWIQSFRRRDISNVNHYVLQFKEHYVVEVVCNTLIFGAEPFEIQQLADQDSRFAIAYFKRAMALEDMGQYTDALLDLDRYIQRETDQDEINWVQNMDMKRIQEKLDAMHE